MLISTHEAVKAGILMLPGDRKLRVRRCAHA